MNKFALRLILSLVFLIAQKIKTDIKYDPNFNRFYSVPMTPDINQDEYNGLYIQVSIITFQCWNNGVYGEQIRCQISSYLKILNTSTSLRFLADLEKDWK